MQHAPGRHGDPEWRESTVSVSSVVVGPYSLLDVVDGDVAAVGEYPLRAGVPNGRSYADHGFGVVATDMLNDGFSLLPSMGSSPFPVRAVLEVGGGWARKGQVPRATASLSGTALGSDGRWSVEPQPWVRRSGAMSQCLQCRGIALSLERRPLRRHSCPILSSTIPTGAASSHSRCTDGAICIVTKTTTRARGRDRRIA